MTDHDRGDGAVAIGPTSQTNIVNVWDDGRLSPGEDATLRWAEALDRFATAQTYWLSVTGTRGPHTRPLLAVVAGGRPCFASASTSRKTALLAEHPEVSLAAGADGMDIVVTGTARRLSTPDELVEVAEAYDSKYGWPAVPEAEALSAPYGAPTAGPAPYLAFALDPTTAHAFGIDDGHAPLSTRWEFPG